MAKKWHQLEKLDHKALKKLQAERERAAKVLQEAQERKRKMIIGSVVLFAIFFIGIFIILMNRRAAEIAYREERAKLLFSEVTKFEGKVQHRNLGVWDELKEKFEFDKEYSFRTSENAFVEVQLQLNNQVKLSKQSEMTVYPPVLAKE
jgi:hypothetical protein